LAELLRRRAGLIYSLTQLLWSAAEHLAPVSRPTPRSESRKSLRLLRRRGHL